MNSTFAAGAIPARSGIASFDLEQQSRATSGDPHDSDLKVASVTQWVGCVLGSAGYVVGMALRAHHMSQVVHLQPVNQFLPAAAGSYNACLNGSTVGQDIGYSAVLQACQATSALRNGQCGWNNVWNLAAGIPAECLGALAEIDQQALATHQRHVARNQYGFIALVVVVAPVAFILARQLGYYGSQMFRNMGNLCGVARGMSV